METNKGQSIIEVIVSVSILVIIASTAVTVILGSFSSTRLAREETKAAILASEGLEAVVSIRNQSWSNLVNGSYGLSNISSTWSFSGSSDIDPTGRFTRTVTVSDVLRDTNGDIVTTGGAVDPDTKRIFSSVAWSFTPTRNNIVDMTLYLTNWGLSKSSGVVNPGVTTCIAYCQGFGDTGGTCRVNSQQCTNNNEFNRSGGDTYCTLGNDDTCCCL